MSFKDKIFNNQSPWGSPPGGDGGRGSSGGNGSGSRQEPPSIDDVIKSFQKKYVQKKRRVVLEGRDMSQIFPNADVKFFVVCRPLKIAAKRRWLQIRKKKQKTSLKEVKKDLIKRDYLDKHRRHSPLVKASDSWYINTALVGVIAFLALRFIAFPLSDDIIDESE